MVYAKKSSFDWLLLAVYLALVSIGLLMLYATGEDFNKEQIDFWASDIGRQCIWAGISFVACIVLSFIDWKFWNTLAYPIYTIGIAILFLLLFLGTEVKGSKSWFILFGFSFQPSEFAKISTILALSAFCSTFKTNLNFIKDQLYAFVIMLSPAGLVLLQPDAGSALTFFALTLILYRNGLPTYYFFIFFALALAVVLSIKFNPFMSVGVMITLSLFFIIDFLKFRLFAGLVMLAFLLGIYVGFRFELMKWIGGIYALVFLLVIQLSSNQFAIRKHLALIGVITFISVFSLAISHTVENVLKPHQRDRIHVWLKPENSDPRGSLYNIIQSKMAIGSGGISGKGFLQGTMTKLNYVPEQKTDFIFSTIGEEQGFIGCLGAIFLFFVLIFRILSIGENASNPFPTYFTYGVVGLIFLHVFINIGMTIGLAPVIGIPLPFISKGGSSLLSFSILIGILLNMSKQNK